MTARWLITPILLLTAVSTAAAQPHLLRRSSTKPGYVCGIPAHDYQYGTRSPSQTAISQIGILLRTRTVVTEAFEAAPAPLRDSYQDERTLRYHPGENSAVVERRIDHAVQMPDDLEYVREWDTNEDRIRPPEVSSTTASNLPFDTSRPGVRRSVFSETLTRQPPPPEPRRQTIIELYQLDQLRLKIDQCEISQVALQLHDDGHWVFSLRADQNRRPDDAEVAEFNPRLHIQRNQFTVRLRCLGAFKNTPTTDSLAAGKPVLVALDPEPFWVENGQPRYVRVTGHCGLIRDYFADIDRVEIEFFYR
jgi:hypothetical protein